MQAQTWRYVAEDQWKHDDGNFNLWERQMVLVLSRSRGSLEG